MHINHAILRSGALLLMLALLCGCGKKGRLYIPSEEDGAEEPDTTSALQRSRA